MSATSKAKLAPPARSEAEKLRIIAEVDAVPDEQKREISQRYGVSPMLVMSWKHDLLGPQVAPTPEAIASSDAPPDGSPFVRSQRDAASYQLEIAMLKEDNRRLRRALAAMLGES